MFLEYSDGSCGLGEPGGSRGLGGPGESCGPSWSRGFVAFYESDWFGHVSLVGQAGMVCLVVRWVS